MSRTIDLAFFTKGDHALESTPDNDHRDRHPRVSIRLPSGRRLDNKRPTNSQIWEARAVSLATRRNVHGVATLAAATAVLERLPVDTRLRDVFFIGHGFPGAFEFSGRRPNRRGRSGLFMATASQTLQAPTRPGDENARFLAALSARCSRRHHVHIVFASCFTGNASSSKRVDIAVAAALQREGLIRFSVGSYVDFYAVRPEVSRKTRKILRFLDRVVFPGTSTAVPGHDTSGPDRLPRFQKTFGQRPAARMPVG